MYVVEEGNTIEFHNKYTTKMNQVHVSACWTALACVVKQNTAEHWLRKNTSALESLLQHRLRAAAVRELGAMSTVDVLG